MRDFISIEDKYVLDTKLGKIDAKVIDANEILIDFKGLVVNGVDDIKGSLRLTRYDGTFEPTFDVHEGKRTSHNHHSLYANRGYFADISDSAKKKIRIILSMAVNMAVGSIIPDSAFKKAQLAQMNNSIMRVESKLNEKQKEVVALEDELRWLLNEEAALGTA